MTELPRYIGRHASPEAAAPPSDETTPDEDPSIPRLDFDPGGSDEATAVLDDSDASDWMPPGPSMPPRPDRWGGPPRDVTPPPGPEPPAREFGLSGTGRLPGSPGRPIRPDSWTMRPDRSSTPLADSVASKPPTPPAPPIPPPFPSAAPPPAASSEPPPAPPPPGVSSTAGPDAEPWTSKAPNIPAGPLPVVQPIVEAVPAPEPVPELSDQSDPEPGAVESGAAVPVPEPDPDDDEIDEGSEPTIETPADIASAVLAADPKSDIAVDPEPDIAPDPASDTAPDPESDIAPDPESDIVSEPTPETETVPGSETNTDPGPETDPEPDTKTEAELDLAPDPEPEPTAPAEPPSSSAPFNAWRDELMLTPAPGPIRRSPVRREIDSHGLARLALLDAIDETWPGGTPDLSAWLAGNLDLLEDPLGFALETRHPVPMSPERQVSGSYDPERSPLDLPGNVVTADESGATVMVRAQVGVADPEGLGALLAAAAASQAQTAVWVCPRIGDGFRQALRWVGGDPSANVRLYGLEMYLVRINDSSTAPLFDAVVAPGAP
jgi:hypothetical protein